MVKGNRYIIIIIIILYFFSCSSIVSKSGSNSEYHKLRQRIEKGLDKDQKLRKLYSKKIEQGEFDINLNNEMGFIDSINQINLKIFLDNFGYPKLSSSGKKISKAVFYLLQHSTNDLRKKYIKDLEELSNIGEASRVHYAMMKDRILVNENRKQIYGTQVVPRKDKNGYITSNYYIWPIENPEIIDELRMKMGFTETILEYSIEMGSEYNPKEKLPK